MTGRTFTATISRVNDHGFQTQEEPGVWRNLSKFDQPPLPIPEPGTVCELTLDSQGYVRAITIVDEPQLPRSASRSAAAPRSDRDATITRLAVLKAAARFLADKPDVKSTDVLIVAALWERWVSRAESADRPQETSPTGT